MTKATILLFVMGLTLVVAGLRFARVARFVMAGRREARWDNPGARLRGMLSGVFAHKRLRQRRFAGTFHAMIFFSFLVLLTSILQGLIEGLFPGADLYPLGFHTILALLQDVFGVIMLTGLGLAAWHRFVIRPKRYAGSNGRDATLILLMAAGIVLFMFLQNGGRIAAGLEPASDWRPVSALLAMPLGAMGHGMAQSLAEFGYWGHLLIVFGFLVYIPGSKHLHMFAAFPNLYFRNIGPRGRLSPAAKLGHKDVPGGLTWKNRLDLLSCTECGRCQSVCPAHAAGQPLNPKAVIMELRDCAMGADAGHPIPLAQLASGALSFDAISACTTCSACMEVCPLHIEHVPRIVDLRRAFLEAGEVEPGLSGALGSLADKGNSFGQPAKARAKWIKSAGFRPKDARSEPVDLLWFVGDFASFDARAQAKTAQFAKLLQALDVDFGLLYEAEANSGNDARRAGDEGLFTLLAEQNIAALADCRFNRILTTDPHSLNALRNDYRDLGAEYEVVHYSTLLRELIVAGRLCAAPEFARSVTYHDPCYLGRYNRIFDDPRAVITGLGHRLVEMPRNREESFCCGAGGGRIFMDDSAMSERPSENRIKEALALGSVDSFVVACPKDLSMYSAAVDSLNAKDRIEVLDLIDLAVETMLEQGDKT